MDKSSKNSDSSDSSDECDKKESAENKIRPKRIPLLNIRKPKWYLNFVVSKKN